MLLDKEIEMKKLVLRKWVAYLLIAINVLAFIVIASDVDDLKLFVVSHLVAGIVFACNSMLIIKYARRGWLDE